MTPFIKSDLTFRDWAAYTHHMSTHARTNSTQHVEIVFTDGERFGEKHKMTMGGHVNLIRRIEERFGVKQWDANRVRPVVSGSDFDGRWIVAGREFTIENVNVL